jgi:hypothetical protein
MILLKQFADLLYKHKLLFVSERLLCLVALGCRAACLATKPLAEGTLVDIVFSSYFRYIFRSRGSQKSDCLIDRSHGCEDIACESALLLNCGFARVRDVHEQGKTSIPSARRLLRLGNALPFSVLRYAPIMLFLYDEME